LESLTECVTALLRYAEQLLKAGSTAFEARHTLHKLAAKMGVDTLSIELGFRSIAATARRGGETVTLVRGTGLPGVNSINLNALQALARDAPQGLLAHDLGAAVQAAEATPHAYPRMATCVAVGLGCGAFAFLNGSGLAEMLAVALGGGTGQFLRTVLVRKHLNPYGIFAICGLAAAAAYVLLYALLDLVQPHPELRFATGIVSTVLFLVPGFPMITAALDFLQFETQIAMSRLVHVLILLLMAALGMSVVIVLADVPIAIAPPPQMDLALLVGARILASFVGAFGFAILFNGSLRNALCVGVLAILGNGIRLALRDFGLSLPLCTFIGALVIGLCASLMRRRVDESRISLTVAAAVMMVPGVYTFQTLVYLNHGDILAGLKSGVLAGFVVGAMALGLALARFMGEPRS
jgi:uncharacterized membrane protein YjjP (DUF1212 family)